MPATDSSSAPFAALGRSMFSLRRDAVEGGGPGAAGGATETEIDAFQRHVADLFQDLTPPPPPAPVPTPASVAAGGTESPAHGAGEGQEILSLLWIRRLLDSFLICQEEFRAILFNSKGALSRPPLDRLVAEFHDRSVKALDVCNAVRDGIDQLRNWEKYTEIVFTALDDRRKVIGEGQLRRARKALADLAIAMLDEKEVASAASGGGSFLTQRNRSFGRHNNGTNSNSSGSRNATHSRSLSWSVSRSWSAAKQLQAMAANLAAPRGNEITATGGLVVPVFTMNYVLLFIMWSLVAAIPCQDRGLQAHFSIPRSYAWAAPVLALHERIADEAKKKENRGSCGLLREIHRLEKCARHLADTADSVTQYPIEQEKEAEIKEAVKDLRHVCEAIKEGIDPLERQVREVFRRIVRGRTEGMDSFGHIPHS